ncbi:MAG: T9SS type A sorting domain-containing protein [Bacteroidetes bacterium]|nr:T9SS type A sorting domain-containing protein [Bacteroidota bacterium]
MKEKIKITILLLAINLNLFSQLQTFYVSPNQTDPNYTTQDSNYIARNTSTQIDKLFLFFGGSFSSPGNYKFICKVAANLGYNAISLCYPNSVPVYPLGSTADSLVFDKFRQEICFGTPQSIFVSVDTLNSIYTRILKLIQYLSVTYPSQNWEQYLLSPTTLDWSKIVVSGHSQGSGHSAYLAKFFQVERNVMFSGPNDYSSHYNRSAHWLRQAGVTPTSKQFVFLHLRDEAVPFSQQFENISGMGMLQTNDTNIIDNVLPPYSNSHCLYSNIEPSVSGKYHSSTCVGIYTPMDSGDTVFLPVWQYMLTTSVTTGTINLKAEIPETRIYPNPTTGIFAIEGEIIKSVEIINITGQTVYKIKVKR